MPRVRRTSSGPEYTHPRTRYSAIDIESEVWSFQRFLQAGVDAMVPPLAKKIEIVN